MIISKTEAEARIDAIEQLTQTDIFSVRISYNKKEKWWEVESFTIDELNDVDTIEKIEEME